MHQLIMGEHSEECIDHYNRNKLDNRKINLHCTTLSENVYNRNKQPNNTSGRTGVLFDKRRNKWISFIQIKSKQIYLGRYENKEDAIRSRESAEKEYFGYIKERDEE